MTDSETLQKSSDHNQELEVPPPPRDKNIPYFYDILGSLEKSLDPRGKKQNGSFDQRLIKATYRARELNKRRQEALTYCKLFTELHTHRDSEIAKLASKIISILEGE